MLTVMSALMFIVGSSVRVIRHLYIKVWGMQAIIKYSKYFFKSSTCKSWRTKNSVNLWDWVKIIIILWSLYRECRQLQTLMFAISCQMLSSSNSFQMDNKSSWSCWRLRLFGLQLDMQVTLFFEWRANCSVTRS